MNPNPKHTIKPARLKAGVTAADLSDGSTTGGGNSSPVIRGKALIFWDPKRPGHKLDAIDTDQITPARDCVSESLDELDKKWKEGTFRYLMPDFRRRVHSGETFIIAGDRFAIGSSREMSPAGLKAIAEEASGDAGGDASRTGGDAGAAGGDAGRGAGGDADENAGRRSGLEMVIVCGENMGDIFRRNALNLGLHVAQCPPAVVDAQDGDAFAFDPSTRALTNETQNKTYDPVALTEKEEEIRRSGGIYAVGRREFRSSVENPPVIEWPDDNTARHLTTTEQIVWAHRVDKSADVVPGRTIRVYADLLPASDGTAPFAIHTFNNITGGDTIFPRRAAVANDHFVFTGHESDNKQTLIGRDFAAMHGMEKPYYATPGDGIFHFYFPEQGLVYPGQFIPGADSHSRAYGAYGAVGTGVGSTTLGFGWSTGYVYFTPARARRIVFTGSLQPWASGKDIVLRLLERWGASQSQGMSVEFVDGMRQLPMAYRNTIANMMAEGEAQNGIFAPDEVTYAWYKEKGLIDLPYPQMQPGENARYAIDEEMDLSEVVPMIAKPFSPGNAFPAEEVAKERIAFDKAFIGSCTNGSYDDLLQAALVVRSARAAGNENAATTFIVFPGSAGVKKRIEEPDSRLGGESIAGVLRSVGAVIRHSWCGPCFGQGEDALEKGQRAITSFNRNWQNRMGLGGEGYLASPAVVAASAMLGYMAPPSELDLKWEPELYEV